MFIRTERLFLRPGWPEDLADLIEAFADPAIQRNSPLSAPLPSTEEGAREYLSRPHDPLMPSFYMYLRGAHGAKLVGGIGLETHGADAEVMYWISPLYRGRGYALEVLRAVMDQARALGHRRLVARHFVDNEAAIRVLEAAGFRDTGDEDALYCPGRGGEALSRLYAVDLERRARPRIESPGQALSA